MPSSHYIESHVSVVSYGATWSTLAQQLSSYWGFIGLLPLIYLLAIKLLPMTVKAQAEAAEYDAAPLPAKGQ